MSEAADMYFQCDIFVVVECNKQERELGERDDILQSADQILCNRDDVRPAGWLAGTALRGQGMVRAARRVRSLSLSS